MVPAEQPSTRAIRFAISAGPLNPVRLQQRRDEAARRGVFLLDVFTVSELLHLQLIRKAMAEGTTWKDAVAAIEAAT